MHTNIKSRAEHRLRRALLTGGLFTTAIGLAHIFMPALGYDRRIAMDMAPYIRDHFYYLATYAICAFLLTLGFISIYISRIPYANVAVVICAAFSVLWIGRTLLEWLYPVQVELFFLTRPTIVLLPVIALIALTYSSGVILYYLGNRGQSV